MEEMIRRLYRGKDARVEKFRIAMRHDNRVLKACGAEWEAVEDVRRALMALEKAEKHTDHIYAHP